MTFYYINNIITSYLIWKGRINLKIGIKAVRFMALVVALIMTVCFFPAAATASNEITGLEAELKSDGRITVSGNITTGGDDVVVMAIKMPSGKVFGELTDGELENAIVYIDQFPASLNGSWTKIFTPRNIADEGRIITIYAGGENVNTTPIAFTTVELPTGILAAPTLTLGGTSPFVWGEDDIVIDVVGDDAYDWIENVEISGVTHAIKDSANGTITIEATNESIKPADALEEKTITLSFENEDYTAVGNITFKVISAVKAIVDGITAPTYDAEFSATAYSVTIPADTAETVYSVKIDGADTTIPAGRVLEVERDTELDKMVAVKATITAGGFTYDHNFSNIIVRSRAFEGPAIGAEDIVLEADGASDVVFGKTGHRVIVIETDEVVYTTHKIKVGDKELFYSPARGKFIGIVNFVDAAAAAAALEIEDSPSTVLYYGKTNNTTDTRAVQLADLMAAYRIFSNTEVGEITDAKYLSSDVTGKVGIVELADLMAMYRVFSGTEADLQINSK